MESWFKNLFMRRFKDLGLSIAMLKRPFSKSGLTDFFWLVFLIREGGGFGLPSIASGTMARFI